MSNCYLKWFTALLLWLGATTVQAELLLMARTQHTFPETMLKLQEEIKNHGYSLSRVQRVDIGLTKSGYQTDKYRVVFFGRAEEIDWIINKYPQWSAYLPLKIAIFAEDQDTILVMSDPTVIFDTQDPKLQALVQGWQKDMYALFHTMRTFSAD